MAQQRNFDAWKRRVDMVLERKIGLSSDDLADQTWRDWFDDGITPAAAADMALENEGYNELSGDM